jgi:hypothetical protein
MTCGTKKDLCIRNVKFRVAVARVKIKDDGLLHLEARL